MSIVLFKIPKRKNYSKTYKFKRIEGTPAQAYLHQIINLDLTYTHYEITENQDNVILKVFYNKIISEVEQ